MIPSTWAPPENGDGFLVGEKYPEMTTDDFPIWHHLRLNLPHGKTSFTPWKINMEPTNHPFRKLNDLPNLHDYVPSKIFRGVALTNISKSFRISAIGAVDEDFLPMQFVSFDVDPSRDLFEPKPAVKHRSCEADFPLVVKD